MVKKEKDLEMKEKQKKNKKKKDNKPKESYFAGVKTEMSKVKWPSKKEVFKYTIATIIFMIVLVVFFILMSIIMSGIKGVFN